MREFVGGKAHRTMLLSGIEFLADQGMYHIVLQFWPEAQQCQKVSLSHRGWLKWVNTVLLWLGIPTALILSALALLGVLGQAGSTRARAGNLRDRAPDARAYAQFQSSSRFSIGRPRSCAYCRTALSPGREKREVEPGDRIRMPLEHRSPHSPAGLERTDAGLGVCRELHAAGRIGNGGRAGGIAGVNARRYRHRRRRDGAVREWRPAVLLSGRQHEAGMYPDRLSSRQA